MKGGVASIAISGAAELIEAYGQDPLLIAKASALPEGALYAPDIAITGLNFYDFLEQAARACHERFFGLEMAKWQGLQILGPIWLLMRNASNVGEALLSLEKNFLLHTEVAAVSLEREMAGMTACYEVLDENLANEAQIIEHGLVLTCMELKAILGADWVPKFTQFRYSAPYNLEPLKKVFGENLHFNQDRHAIHIPEKDIGRAITYADSNQKQLLQQQLHSQIETAGRQLINRTEMVIRALIVEENCHLNKVALVLGMSSRTLQRQLKLDGITFQRLYEKVRLDMAKKYLAYSDLSIGAVAERLHFSETAVFTRFFKRQTALTPRQFVKKNH